jgi:ribosomal-protein-alanine N-acetyltransferase
VAVGRWPVVLQEGPVRLRPVRVRDERAWAEIRQRGATWFRPWDSTRPPDSVEDAVTFAGLVRRSNARARHGGMLPWAVEYTPAGGRPRFVGQVTVGGITHGSASWAQIGYWIDPAWAGRGIIPTAVAMACDYCFAALRLHRIEIAIRPENANSVAVVRKLGFRFEGRRPRYMHVDGDWRDHDMYALHREEAPEGVLARYLARKKVPGTP